MIHYKMKKLLLIIILMLSCVFVNAQESVVIPNIFTPNNDGVNDIFYVKSTGYNTLTCTIFNRYGDVVYQYFGLNGNWDGYTHAGIKCNDGTYFVIVNVTNDAGEITTYQGTLQLAGN